MNEPRPDFTLLQDFARDGNQQAFADVVRRHLDLVYATALRKLTAPAAAQEVAQNVFAALARKAWQFAPDDSLPAWLYKTTLLEAKSWLRGELRRRRREQTAVELGTTMKTPDEQPALRALVPLLDEALLSLRESDRTALLLRFYDSQSLRDVGVSLGTSEEAARKRVQSALERLAHFFQRRGFKTATVASTTVMLQQTAISASSATAGAVVTAALQAAPPALVGLSALLARFASLTKLQTAVVCVALAAAPVAWQWQQQNELRGQAEQAEKALAAQSAELTSLQAEQTRLRETHAKRETDLAQAKAEAAARATAMAQLGDWKIRLQERLLAADYQWPEDLSLVRIPKAVVPALDISQPIRRPGQVATEARELLGLSHQERQQAEELLQEHFSAMDKLAGESFYQTNTPSHAYLPKDAIVSRVWEVPKLGAASATQIAAFKSGLESILAGDRWNMVSRSFESTGMGVLANTLNLGAAETRTEIAGWLLESGGELKVSLYTVGDIHERGTYWSGGSPEIPVRLLLADNVDSDPMTQYSWMVQSGNIATPVKENIVAWIRQEAARLGEGASK